MNVFDLSAKVTLDINGYLKGMDTAKAVALSTAGAIGGAISGFMDESVNVGKTFDSSMSQVAATMGKTMSEMDNAVGSTDTSFGHFEGTLRDFAQFMGRNTAFTASQAADALNYMALAGYDVEESMEMLPNVLNLAAAGNMDLARASDMVTDTQTAFGISADRTSQMVDEMAKAASTGNTSVEQLGDAFLVVGALAQNLNGGFVTLSDGTEVAVDGIQEMEIALTAMANAGIKGSEAGTHVRNMIMKLSNPTKQGAEVMEKLGLEVFDAEGNMRSLKDIMGDLNTSLGTLTQEEKIQAIAKLFNARDLASAQALLNSIGQDWDDIGEAIINAEGAAGKMAETQLDNLAGDTKLFESALEGLQIALSDSVTPALRKMKQGGTRAISALTEAFLGLPPEAQTAIGVIADFGGKALSVAPQVLGLAGNIGQISMAMSSAGTAGTSFMSIIGGLAGPVAIAGAAIAVGITLFANYKQRIQEAAAEEAAFAEQLAGTQSAYQTTHEQVQTLISGQNEYISTEQRIAELEGLRVQVANEKINAQNNLKDAQEQLTAKTSELEGAEKKLDETRRYSTTGVTQQKEEVEKLKAEHEQLTTAYDSANETYDQTTTDLDEINAALESLYEEQKKNEEAVNATGDAYSEFSTEITDQMLESAADIVSGVLDMQEALSNSISSIGNWFDEVAKQEEKSAKEMKSNLKAQIDAVKDWEKDLDYLADKGINQEFLTYLADMGPSASSYVTAMKDDILEGGQATVDEWNSLYQEKLDLESGINTEAQNVYDAIIAMEDGGAEAFNELTEAFNLGGYNAGDNLTLGLIEGLKNQLQEMEDAAKEEGESAVDALNEGAGVESPSWKTQETGEYMGEGLIDGLNNKGTEIYKAGSDASTQAVNGANSVDLYNKGVNIGYWFDMGLANGISSYASSVANSAWYAAQNAVNTVKSVMRIGSPSKIADYFGKMWDVGLEQGISKNADKPVDAMRNMTNDILDEANVDIGTTDYMNSGYGTTDNARDKSMNVTMNIYGSEGQDVRELANIISQELAIMMQEGQAVFA